MEIAGTTLSAVQTLLTALQCPQLKDIRSIVEYKSELDDLQSTVQTVDSVLRDAAEIKQELLSHEDQCLIEKLKDAIFEADDLLDEFVTLAQQKQLLEADGRVSEKLRSFFSLSSNPLSVAYRMSRGVKKIKHKLDAIVYSKQFSFKHDPQFSFKHDPQPIRNRRPETCSYVDKVDIIGRENDLNKIVGMLLDSCNVQRDVSFLSIVGVGGLGKTALAQLVFNDPRITSVFSLRKWTCVADEDQKELDVKQVLCKILGKNFDDMDRVQSLLREQLQGQKYLFVLDDVWTEEHIQWCDLVKYLSGGQKGSCIVVTTRSQRTATIVGGQMHELPGLSKDDSWCLFERTAFTSDQSNPPNDLVEIGQKIVAGCAGVPLAIRVAGSLLFGQDKNKWQSVEEIGLANIRESQNGILPILKLSFHHLESPLKSCFSYCALFPKDFQIEKEMLKSLWMAQGYIVPLDKGQSIEDACEEYFTILWRRCFFQEVIDYDGDIYCKIHDLMHDIAQNILGNEIFYATKTIRDNLNKKVRHLSVANMREYGKYSLSKTHIRSHLHVDSNIHISSHLQFYSNMEEDAEFPVEALVANFRRLRALDLSGLRIKSLSECIGELLHLRYLDLSGNQSLKELPNSITKLYNLQTLNLRLCRSLRELPKDLSRLVKLRFLDVRDCLSLTYMPTGMGQLTCLDKLSDFMVGGEGSRKQWFDSLEDLKALNNLKGRIDIQIRRTRNVVNKEADQREGLYLINKEHLNHITFNFRNGRKNDEESLMEDLQPHSNLKELKVIRYNGVKMPGWLTLLPNMASLHLEGCAELENLPCLRNLRHLKYLRLCNLVKLEYIGVDCPSRAEDLSFFPSLEEINFSLLPKLKGWSRRVVGQVEDNPQSLQLLPCFPRSSALSIFDCPELTCFPLCPSMKQLKLYGFNKGLQICTKRDEIGPSSSSASTPSIVYPRLQSVRIDSVAWLNSLPLECFQCIQRLDIFGLNEEMVDLPSWMQFMPTLQTLSLEGCRALKEMPNWMPKLTSLRSLSLMRCSESLKRRCQKDPPGFKSPAHFSYST